MGQEVLKLGFESTVLDIPNLCLDTSMQLEPHASTHIHLINVAHVMLGQTTLWGWLTQTFKLVDLEQLFPRVFLPIISVLSLGKHVHHWWSYFSLMSSKSRFSILYLENCFPSKSPNRLLGTSYFLCHFRLLSPD